MTPASLHLMLQPQSTPDHYLLTSDAATYPLDLRPETLSDYLRRLRPVLVGGSDPSEFLAPPDLLREIGVRLWRALFPDTAPAQERESLANALRLEVTPLLLTLPPALAELPWELLCDPDREDDAAFLVSQRPLARLVPGGRELPPLAPPLRVLLLISSPPGLREGERLDVESERAAVEQATRSQRASGFLHLLVEDRVTIPRVQRALLSFKPHIVHFIGHGSFVEGTGGVLWWEDEQGDPLPISETQVASLLRPRGLRAVILHSCETATSSLHGNLRGMAGALMEAGIPAVLAQQANFTYASSQQASDLFYTSLCSGLGMAEATFEARQALALTNRPDWAVPTVQATTSGLLPLLDLHAPPGVPDPLLGARRLPGGLPAPTGVFVGRQQELRALRTMLESLPGSGPTVALLTGPGGIGKSTLAAQSIARYSAQYKAALTLSCVGYPGIDLFLQRIGEFVKNQDVSWLLEETLPDPKQSTDAKIEATVEALNQAGPILLIIDNLESVQGSDRTLSDLALLLLVQHLLTNLRNGRVLITGRYRVERLLPRGKFAASLLSVDLDDLNTRESMQLLDRHPALARLNDPVRMRLVQEFGGLPYVYDLLSRRADSASLEALVYDIQGRLTQERKQRSLAEWQQVRQDVVEFVALTSTAALLPKEAYQLLGELSIFRRPFSLQALEQGVGVTRAEWQPLLDYGLLRFDSSDGEYHLHSLTRHFAEGLLDEVNRASIQRKVADWYLRYGRETSHDLADYLEAHALFRAAGDTQQAGRLALDLGETLSRFGLYTLWRSLCQETIDDTQAADDTQTAEALHHLGIIAQEQGDYPEARRLFAQSLEIKERLGDQGGRAITLGQLGILAQEQKDYPAAVRYTLAALDTFEHLHSPSRTIALRALARIRAEMGEAAFVEAWKEVAAGRPLPDVSRANPQEGLLQQLVAFIRANTWAESQRLVETHPEFLETQADAVLEQLIAVQQDDQARALIEQNRQLLARCRAVGIAAAFAEQQESQEQSPGSEAEAIRLNALCRQVVATLRIGDKTQCEALATHLESKISDFSMDGVGDFLALLAAWLRSEEIAAREERLQPAFQQAYQHMKVAVDAEQDQEDSDEAADDTVQDSENEHPITVEDLPRLASVIFTQGAMEDRQRLAADLGEAQRGLPPEAAALGTFLGCLVTALLGETPDTTTLEDPFTQLWQEFQEARAKHSSQQDHQEGGADGKEG